VSRSTLREVGVLVSIELFVAPWGNSLLIFSLASLVGVQPVQQYCAVSHVWHAAFSFLSIGTADVVEVKSHVEPRPHILGNVHAG